MSVRPMRDIALHLYDREQFEMHCFQSDAFEVYIDGRLYLWNRPDLPGKPVDGLIDEGENMAVRAFLQLYGQPGVTIEQMRDHLDRSGFPGCWPAWADPCDDHLTKMGAQVWLRHLFALEGGEP